MSHPLALAQRLSPEIVGAGLVFSGVTSEKSILSLREHEGARIRTAELNGCQVCLAFRSGCDLARLYGPDAQTVAANGPAPDAGFYAAISDWRTSPLFSDRERLAIEYAERLGTDPKGVAVDEDFWSRAKALFSDAEIVDLSFCIACWLGQGRVTHALGLDEVACSL
jgi:alkylhydroperoxidase family enzyme